MKAKTLDILLLLLIIISFIGYFSIRNYILSQDSIYEKLCSVEKLVEEKQWDKALKLSKDLENTWNKQKFIIMLNMGEEDFSYISESFHGIVAGVQSKSLDSILSNVEAAKDNWENMNKFVPEP
jgi:Domain of unknown function (DUF4363)